MDNETVPEADAEPNEVPEDETSKESKGSKKVAKKKKEKVVPKSAQPLKVASTVLGLPTAETDAELSKNKKSKKKGKGKSKKKGSKREKVVRRKCEDFMEPDAMLNAYYVCHGVQDMLTFRRFVWKKKK